MKMFIKSFGKSGDLNDFLYAQYVIENELALVVSQEDGCDFVEIAFE